MKKAVIGIICAAAAVGAIAADQKPYEGQQDRSIKALSDQEVTGYLNGHGMGHAKAAELNHYPGPRHVLDMSEKLSLTEMQEKRTRAIYRTMKTRASDLGERLVETERELDRLFASGTIDGKSLGELVSEIAALEGKIRGVHLKAHLEQKALLTGEQVRTYDRNRGYGRSGDHRHHGSGK